MNHTESSQPEVKYMEVTSTQWTELLDCGVLCTAFQKRHTKWRLTTYWANSPESPRRRDLETATVTSILFVTSPLVTPSQPPRQTSSMSITANHRRDRWCDICKMRWGMIRSGLWHPNAQRTARWIVKSETKGRLDFERAYCQECSNELQTWPDGTTWSFRDQLNYALGKQELNGLELG
jgi:hypothetical protein